MRQAFVQVSNLRGQTAWLQPGVLSPDAAESAILLRNNYRFTLLLLIPTIMIMLLILSLLERRILRLSKFTSSLAAEFVGTFSLVFTVGCCVTAGTSTWNATAIGCVLMVMIYATGPISGGNLNPAVSLALGLAGKLEADVVVLYCCTQLFAGVVAGVCCVALFTKTMPYGPVPPFAWSYAFIAELIYTCMICFVVLNCAAARRNNPKDDSNQFYALAIGFVMIVGGYAVGDVSGAAFNPAVAFGLGNLYWGLIWTAAELAGAALASYVFRCVRPEDYIPEADVPNYKPTLPTMCLSEFLGTFILVFTVGLNVMLGSQATAWSAGAALMCMIYSLGDVSGGHFNPAVTLALVLSGREKCTPVTGCAFCVAQLVGAIFAGLLCAAFHLAGPNATETYALTTGTYPTLVGSVLELVFTFVLAYVFLAVATVSPPQTQGTKHSFYFALAIGACVTGGGFAIGHVSGGEFNPAVSAGVAVASLSASLLALPSDFSLTFVMFVIFEFMGGAIAAGIFFLTHSHEFKPHSHVKSPAQKYISEAVGTFTLVFTVGCCLSTGSSTWNATAIGCVFMAMVYATAPVSGGNLNPAVSLALALCGKCPWKPMLIYCVTQLAAGIAAGLCHWALLFESVPVAASEPFTWGHAVIVEIIYTCMLCLVVLNCAVSKRTGQGNQFFALAIGFVIIAGGYAAGGISGAAFNPAVSLGLDISSGRILGGLVWTISQLTGAILSAILFHIVRSEDYMPDVNLVNYKPSLRVKCISEFLGVFVLVFTVGLNVTLGSTATALSAGAALMCMIYSLWDVSGGHFNPAVTLAIVFSGRAKCPLEVAVPYWAAQLCAGICAGVLLDVFRVAGSGTRVKPLQPGNGYLPSQAMVLECCFTFMLAYVVLSVATVSTHRSQKAPNNYFGLAIGSCVAAGGLAAGGVSGGALNPAVSVGITTANLVIGSHRPDIIMSVTAFALYEIAGGLLASVVFHMTHPSEYQLKDEG